MERSDEALCREVADRKPGAFDLLVERYQERAYRIAWSVLGDAEDARDCSQDAFIRLHEHARSFGGQAKFSTWFYRIVVNCCLDHRRRIRGWQALLARREAPDGQRADDLLDRQPAATEDPIERIEDTQRMSRLWLAVERLSPQQRAAVVLQCREGLSTREVAAVLGLAEATVRVHLHRAFAALRRDLGGAS